MDAKTKLLQIVDAAKGDDLERATREFAPMSGRQLDVEHGYSGKTRRQVLGEYQVEREEWEAARTLAASL